MFKYGFFRSVPKPTITDESSNVPNSLKRELGLILKEIKLITEKIKDDEESSSVEGDWKFAAMVLDRLCLILFTVFTMLATVAVLWAAPHVIVT